MTINNTEKCLPDWEGCRWVVHKRLLEVVNQVDKDRVFYIRGTVDERRDQVVGAVATLEREVVDRLFKFVETFGGLTDFVCVKMWIPDNKIMHDRIVDSVPLDLTFRNDVVKKVYNTLPSSVEYSSPALASNAFRNLALLDVSPEIVSELRDIREEVGLLSKDWRRTRVRKLLEDWGW